LTWKLFLLTVLMCFGSEFLWNLGPVAGECAITPPRDPIDASASVSTEAWSGSGLPIGGFSLMNGG